MNAEQFHQALNHLPEDLIAATDALRSRPRRRYLRRYAAMAACLAVMLLSGWMLGSGLFPGYDKAASTECAMEETLAAMAQFDAESAAEAGEEAAPAETAAYCVNFLSRGTDAATEFAVRLLQGSVTEENTLLSPLSAMSALAMTANGADGETLTQMEATLGMGTDSLNQYFREYLDDQTDDLMLANAIWFSEGHGFVPEEAFLEVNSEYYDAQVFQTPLNGDAVQSINRWVSENTNGRIPSILDDIPGDAVMYLVNALSFESEWAVVYDETQVQEGTFTKEDGTQQSLEMMSSQEFCYLEDENTTGFVKYYAGGDYAFAALLPGEGVTVADYAASLTGERLRALLDNPLEVTVFAKMPKFEISYSAELSELLADMGMGDAFDPERADFSRMGSSREGNVLISRVLHKTAISVAEQGTGAGAATAVEMRATGAYEQEVKQVELNRPFVYMIIDCETCAPIFIGTLMDPEG